MPAFSLLFRQFCISIQHSVGVQYTNLMYFLVTWWLYLNFNHHYTLWLILWDIERSSSKWSAKSNISNLHGLTSSHLLLRIPRTDVTKKGFSSFQKKSGGSLQIFSAECTFWTAHIEKNFHTIILVEEKNIVSSSDLNYLVS